MRGRVITISIVSTILLCCCELNAHTSIINASSAFDPGHHYFPVAIPEYPVRMDIYTDRAVSISVLTPEDLNNVEMENNNKMDISSLKQHLQCAPHEPAFGDDSGAWDLMKLITPTRETFELIATWAETGCKPWLKCHDEMAKLRKQDFHGETGIHLRGPGDAFRSFKLERIIDGELYTDWPWGANRLQPTKKTQTNNFLLGLFLKLASGIPNVAYFRGGERPGIPWNFPIPIFSNAPELGYVDMAWPWAESVSDSYKWLNTSESSSPTDRKLTAIWKKDSIEVEYNDTLQRLDWQNRKGKAAYYGVFKDIRQVLFEVALQNPDLIDARSAMNVVVPLEPLNPLSTEVPITSAMYNDAALREIEQSIERPTGYAWPLTRLFGGDPNYSPRNYKYLIVLLGSKGLSTSGRLANFLAHSGAVILLQKSAFSYDFTARLVPWVHYVPLSYSAADVAVKIKWLQANDEMALQIARNARNFGRSYLRLEDHLCYVANAFEALAELQNGTDVQQPWAPVRAIG